MVKIEKLWKQWRKQDDIFSRDRLLNEIWQTYYPKLSIYIINLISIDNDSVSDTVSDILTKVFEKIHSYNPEYRFSTWIYTVARNHITDLIRSSVKNRIDYHPAESFISVPDLTVDIERDFIFGEYKNILENNINMLEHSDRELLYLRFYEKLKYSEISELTSIPVGTVKNRIFLVKRILKEAVENVV